ncbi:MAG: Rrf2 family transcriptional regulator [Hyphomicrobium sp.]|nr:Rrf2 family transcriptional regulator [Hyphomicrobium sp.]MBN9279542.1 Rrf2 family transcriptional regulator [Hyphomicrobium sp.]
MRLNSRLSDILHVLLHMAEHDGPVTSEMLAKAMGTNPAVIRRIMAALIEPGYVRSEKGHGGGWTLARDLEAISLRDVHDALGPSSIFAIGNRSEAPKCLVEQAANTAVSQAMREAEELLLTRFAQVTLASLRVDIHRRLKHKRGSLDLEAVHAS